MNFYGKFDLMRNKDRNVDIGNDPILVVVSSYVEFTLQIVLWFKCFYAIEIHVKVNMNEHAEL